MSASDFRECVRPTPSGHLDFPEAAIQAYWVLRRFASTKQPFVISHTRPKGDIRGIA